MNKMLRDEQCAQFHPRLCTCATNTRCHCLALRGRDTQPPNLLHRIKDWFSFSGPLGLTDMGLLRVACHWESLEFVLNIIRYFIQGLINLSGGYSQTAWTFSQFN